MSQAGYTLVEMLVALAVLGLAIGGLAGASGALRRLQLQAASPAAEARALTRAQSALRRLLDGSGPFAAEAAPGFFGGERELSFTCGGAAPCAARLTDAAQGAVLTVRGPAGEAPPLVLPGAAGARFAYADEDGRHGAWPQAAARPDRPPRTLRSVAVVKGQIPLAVVRVWPEQTAECQYDSVVRRCREAAP